MLLRVKAADNAMHSPVAAPPVLSSADITLAYHARTKHRLARYAAGPETLDWDSQPDPFREFAGCPRTPLPLNSDHLDTSFAELTAPNGRAGPLSIASVATLLELSLGLSAWKQYGPDRWALRCNPSSGNLHPTEAYVIAANVPALDDGLYHYVSRDHALELRCRRAERSAGPPLLWIGFNSVNWREAWKYGERAFRYAQLDIGHALGAVRYAAAALGWRAQLVEDLDGAAVAARLGLDRARLCRRGSGRPGAVDRDRCGCGRDLAGSGHRTTCVRRSRPLGGTRQPA